jgi:hypothetical protein
MRLFFLWLCLWVAKSAAAGATDLIGCDQPGHKGRILAPFQSSDMVGRAASWVWHLIVASRPQHHQPPYIGPARVGEEGSDCAIPVSSHAVITNRPLPAVQ